ncbi:MAG: tetratricopeptide repeat protein, partial [Armatimonadaceae bacterium]
MPSPTPPDFRRPTLRTTPGAHSGAARRPPFTLEPSLQANPQHGKRAFVKSSLKDCVAFAAASLALLGIGCAQAPKTPTPQPAPQATELPTAPRSSALRNADALRDQGKILEAVEAYAAAGQAEPSDHRPWYEIGRILLANNQPEDARDAFAEAIRREPGTTVGDAWHGLAMFRSGDPENGLKLLREAVDAVPDNPEAHALLADACRDYGLLTDERYARENTVRLAADNPEHWRNLGKACYAGKDFGRLADIGAKLTAIKPDDPDGPVWQSMGVAMLGDDDAVQKALPTARET